MPKRKVDPSTGFIEFVRTPEELKLDNLEKSYSTLSDTVAKLTEILRSSNIDIPDSILKGGDK